MIRVLNPLQVVNQIANQKVTQVAQEEERRRRVQELEKVHWLPQVIWL